MYQRNQNKYVVNGYFKSGYFHCQFGEICRNTVPLKLGKTDILYVITEMITNIRKFTLNTQMSKAGFM